MAKRKTKKDKKEKNEKAVSDFLCETVVEADEEINIVNLIETGLNIIAQDILWKHTEKEIDNFINRFRFV